MVWSSCAIKNTPLGLHAHHHDMVPVYPHGLLTHTSFAWHVISNAELFSRTVLCPSVGKKVRDLSCTPVLPL